LHRDGVRRPPCEHRLASLTPSTDETPSLLTLNEARTIFHRVFGHALHSLFGARLLQRPFRNQRAVGFLWNCPARSWKNWLLEEEALTSCPALSNWRTPLPKELLDKVIAAKNFQAGIAI
jgi:oligopeptidase A